MKDKGFTLIEVVVVLVLLAILAGITTIGVVSSTNRLDDESTIMSISEALESGRFEAMANKDGSFEVKLNYEPDGYHLYTNTDNKISNAKRILYLNIEKPLGTIKNAYDINSMTIKYDKATGSIKGLEVTTIDDTDVTNLELDNDSVLTITTEQYKKRCILATETGRTVVK